MMGTPVRGQTAEAPAKEAGVGVGSREVWYLDGAASQR